MRTKFCKEYLKEHPQCVLSEASDRKAEINVIGVRILIFLDAGHSGCAKTRIAFDLRLEFRSEHGLFVRVFSEFVLSFLYTGLAMDQPPYQMSERFMLAGINSELEHARRPNP
jgi:hypothetical protein